MMDAVIREAGGGFELNVSSEGLVRNDEAGTGRAMIDHATEMLDIHRDLRRGSRDRLDFSQYLSGKISVYSGIWGQGGRGTYSSSSSGQASRIFTTSSACLVSSFGFKVDMKWSETVLYNLAIGCFPSSAYVDSNAVFASGRGYHPLDLKQIPTPGRVHIARRN